MWGPDLALISPHPLLFTGVEILLPAHFQPSALLPAADQHVSGDLGFFWQKLYLPVLWEGSRHSWSAQGQESSQSTPLTDWDAAPSWEPLKTHRFSLLPRGTRVAAFTLSALVRRKRRMSSL